MYAREICSSVCGKLEATGYTAATMAAPRPEPSLDDLSLILFPGASSSSATLILCFVYAKSTIIIRWLH